MRFLLLLVFAPVIALVYTTVIIGIMLVRFVITMLYLTGVLIAALLGAIIKVVRR